MNTEDVDMENKEPKTKEEIIAEDTSMNIGLSACIVLYLAVIKDILGWGFGITGYHLNGIIGTVAIFSSYAILKFNLCGKIIKKREELKTFVDMCTLSSVMLFTFENGVFDYVKEGEKLPVSIAFGIVIGLPFFALFGIFLREIKKNKANKA